MDTKRIGFIDGLRAISVLYIVGFWHLMNYVDGLHGYHNPVTTRITVIVLGLFVFLSGLLLGGQKLACDKGSLASYLRRRIVRIYPLYLLSLALFLDIGLIDSVVALKAALMLSMFSGPAPLTLWFVAMLLVFYCFAPLLILVARRNTALLAAVSVTIFLMLYIAVSFSGDQRLVLYFPVFVLGIFWAQRAPGFGWKYKALVLGLLLFSTVISVLTEAHPEHSLLSIPIAVLGPIGIFVVAERVFAEFRSFKILILLNYSGFAMFLMHRPIFEVIRDLYFPRSELFQLAYLIFLCLPLVIGVSWLLQYTYDRFLRVLRQARAPASARL